MIYTEKSIGYQSADFLAASENGYFLAGGTKNSNNGSAPMETYISFFDTKASEPAWTIKTNTQVVDYSYTSPDFLVSIASDVALGGNNSNKSSFSLTDQLWNYGNNASNQYQFLVSDKSKVASFGTSVYKALDSKLISELGKQGTSISSIHSNQDYLAIAVSFSGTLNYGSKTLVAENAIDSAILLLDKLGNISAPVIASGINTQEIQHVKVGAKGEIYWAGSSYNKLSINGEVKFTPGEGYSYQAKYISKVSKEGKFEWFIPVSGMGIFFENTTDTTTNGQFGYIAIDEFELSSSGEIGFGGFYANSKSTSAVFGIIDSIGTKKASKVFSGTESQLDGLSSDDEGGWYLGGFFKSGFELAGKTYPSKDTDIFICHIDKKGNFDWVKVSEGNGNKYLKDLIKMKDGSIVVSGSFTGELTLESETKLSEGWVINGSKIEDYDKFVVTFQPNNLPKALNPLTGTYAATLLDGIKDGTIGNKDFAHIQWDKFNFETSGTAIYSEIDWGKINMKNLQKFGGLAINWSKIEFSEFTSKQYKEINWTQVSFSSLTPDQYEAINWSKVNFKGITAQTYSQMDFSEVITSKGFSAATYKSVDWSKVDYSDFKAETYQKTDWSKVSFGKLSSSSYSAMDWSQVVTSTGFKAATYKAVNWGLVDFGDYKSETYQKTDWSKVNFKQFSASSYSSLDWSQVITASAFNAAAYKRVNWGKVDFGDYKAETYQKTDWSKVNFKQFSASSYSSLDWSQVITASGFNAAAYKSVNWGQVDFGDFKQQTFATTKWNHVKFKQLSASQYQAINWNEINLGALSTKTYKAIDWKKVNVAAFDSESIATAKWGLMKGVTKPTAAAKPAEADLSFLGVAAPTGSSAGLVGATGQSSSNQVVAALTAAQNLAFL